MRLMKHACAIPVLLAAACSTVPHWAAIPGAGTCLPLPSAIFSRETSVTQHVTIRGKTSWQFLLQTEVDPTGLRMAGLTAFGQKLFELQYIDNTLTVNKTPFLPDALVPEKLFADFQLIYWPDRLLRDQCERTNIEILETASEQGQQRQFRHAGTLIVDILYNPARGIESGVLYRDLRQGYTMRIATLPDTIAQ
jgi:hypothetical protein